MATYTVDKIEYNSNVYVLQDSGALQLTGGQVTGPVTFGDAISVDEATIGDLVVNGNASFTNNIQANTINGIVVGNSPSFTDTNNAVTQTATITDANYEILFSATADNTTRTEGARKTSTLTYNPSTKKLTTGAIYATAIGDSSRSYIDQKTNKLSLLVNDDDEYSNSEIIVESGQITLGFNTNKFLTAQQNDNTGVISVVLTNLVTPTNDTDATNKKYVDDKYTKTTATLTTTWSSNQQTVTVSGVTTSNTVIVTPAPASYNMYCECGVYCSTQAANSLTFTCDEVPTSSLTVNIVIMS